ncbi:MAG: hypothetical protein M3Z50_00735 [Actinomycetota bacterium]|nr:hypothetical protein [Actinomycetota bacterium]
MPALGVLLYLLIVPTVPDLAAQTARAAMVRQAGFTVWWPGWFGGLELPTYSVIAPSVMSVIGAPLTGALSAVICVVAMHHLMRHSLRPTAASITFSVMVLLNLVNGRITYLVGVAFALGAVLALANRKPWLAAVGGVLSCLASPLAGLFLGIAAAAVVLGRRDYRREALWAGGSVALVLGTLAVLFSGVGVMPAPLLEMFFGFIGVVLVAVGCEDRTVRIGCLLVALVLVCTTIVPTAIGVNITRMVWMLGPPLIAAYCRRPLPVVATLVVLTSVFPTVDTTRQVIRGDAPSALPMFYRPLIHQLRARAAADPSAVGQRAEVLEPETKGAARYVSLAVPIARGWERQTDMSENPIFYQQSLSAATYHRWLKRLAVGWVAVPNAALDFGSLTEKALIDRHHPGYLRLVWSDPNWHLYRVLGSRPLAVGARVVSVRRGLITLRADRAGPVQLAVRWSPYLDVRPVASSLLPAFPPPACVQQAGRWSQLQVRTPGEYVIGSYFAVWPFVQYSSKCASGPPS